MDSFDVFIYAILCLLGLYIQYSIIKAAVRNGIREARKDLEPVNRYPAVKETQPNERQIALQEKYNRGKINLEEYRREWENSVKK